MTINSGAVRWASRAFLLGGLQAALTSPVRHRIPCYNKGTGSIHIWWRLPSFFFSLSFLCACGGVWQVVWHGLRCCWCFYLPRCVSCLSFCLQYIFSSFTSGCNLCFSSHAILRIRPPFFTPIKSMYEAILAPSWEGLRYERCIFGYESMNR